MHLKTLDVYHIRMETHKDVHMEININFLPYFELLITCTQCSSAPKKTQRITHPSTISQMLTSGYFILYCYISQGVVTKIKLNIGFVVCSSGYSNSRLMKMTHGYGITHESFI